MISVKYNACKKELSELNVLNCIFGSIVRFSGKFIFKARDINENVRKVNINLNFIEIRRKWKLILNSYFKPICVKEEKRLYLENDTLNFSLFEGVKGTEKCFSETGL